MYRCKCLKRYLNILYHTFTKKAIVEMFFSLMYNDNMVTVNFNPNVDMGKTTELLRSIMADKMGGWFTLPGKVNTKELSRIIDASRKIQSDSEYLVCIGIGGSYLGHRAVIEALRPRSRTKVIYAGNSLSQRELNRVLEEVGEHDFSINVISKSGKTLEPAVAFAAFKKKLAAKYGAEEAVRRIYVTTDADTGMLHDEAVTNGYIRFVIPGDIGGRYSVLTAVGLLPMAVAGVDVDDLLAGAIEQSNLLIAELSSDNGVAQLPDGNVASLADNPAVKYAWTRYALGSNKFDTEVFATFEPSTAYFSEWLKQLFGESEGKNGQGVWPASVIYTTDLHSLGQFMQEGRRNVWETIIDYPTDEMNAKAVTAVRKAHTAGGIPVLSIRVDTFNERAFGQLIYFFEVACAMSAKLFGVNPFDQPGVEAYKTELQKLVQLV